MTEIIDTGSDDPPVDDNDSPKIFNQLLASCISPSDDDANPDGPPADLAYIVTGDTIDILAQTSDKFEGACVDSGAQVTVIGKPQASAYAAEYGSSPRLGETKRTYRFGDERHVGLGTINIDIPVSGSHYVKVVAEIVDVDVPFLLGLDVLTHIRAILDFNEDRLSGKFDDWSVPLVRKMGHLYVEWPVRVLFSSTQLRRIHRHFKHPSAERLYALIKRAEPHGQHPELMRELEDIQRNCDVCQRVADAPWRFRVSLPDEEDTFNSKVCLDIMKLAQRSVLHAVDKSTRFGAARFLASESTSTIWSVFDQMWAQSYVGLPNTIVCDQGSVFTSAEWETLLRSHAVERQVSGVESHNALGVGERYHSFLRRIFEKVKADSSDIPDEYALALAVKAANDTAGPHGLSPTLLVFGVTPRLPLRPQNLPDNHQRMRALRTAKSEMARLISRARLETALSRRVPAAADVDIQIGDEVLWFRDKPVGRWTGPFIVTGRRGQLLQIDDGDRTTTASIDRVKPYHTRLPPSDEGDSSPAPATPSVSDTHSAPSAPVTPPEQSLQRRLDEILGPQPNGPLGDEAIAASEFVVKLLDANDPRVREDDFEQAKRKEVDGLNRRGLWRKVKRSELPPDANILGGRFIFSLKNYGTPSEMAKVRFVAQGYRDKDKPFMVHDASSLRASSIRIILAVAACLGFRLFSHDVTQAYLQSKYRMTRDVYVDPKPADRHLFGIGDEELLKLELPLYGVCDAGDYWGITVFEHNVNDLGMLSAPGDASLYVKRSTPKDDSSVDGVSGMYVDDSINAGNERFEQLTEMTLQKFESKPRTYDDFDFFGAQIRTILPHTFTFDQRHYSSNLAQLPTDASFEDFRRTRALFSWLIHTRPDVACLANKSAQVTPLTFSNDKIQDLNKGIRRVSSTPRRGLTYKPLDQKTVHLRVYADASHATNDDLSSQLGYLILLADASNACHVIDYASRKSRRVVRSIMGGETCALLDAFDAAFAVSADLKMALGRELYIAMFTDSKQLFDALVRGKRTTERRLMIEIHSVRQSYQSFEISRIGLVRGTDNPADGVSKIGHNGALDRLLDTQMDNTDVIEWIERTHRPPTPT